MPTERSYRPDLSNPVTFAVMGGYKIWHGHMHILATFLQLQKGLPAVLHSPLS
jgi:hypothetical protein